MLCSFSVQPQVFPFLLLQLSTRDLSAGRSYRCAIPDSPKSCPPHCHYLPWIFLEQTPSSKATFWQWTMIQFEKQKSKQSHFSSLFDIPKGFFKLKNLLPQISERQFLNKYLLQSTLPLKIMLVLFLLTYNSLDSKCQKLYQEHIIIKASYIFSNSFTRCIVLCSNLRCVSELQTPQGFTCPLIPWKTFCLSFWNSFSIC